MDLFQLNYPSRITNLNFIYYEVKIQKILDGLKIVLSNLNWILLNVLPSELCNVQMFHIISCIIDV